MSKKLLIILISVVLTVGIAATVVTGVVFSPVNKAKRSLKSGDDAQKVSVVLSQTYYGDEVNRIMTDYEKTTDGYKKAEKSFKLSKDALSQTLYDIEEKTSDISSVDFFPFSLKQSYFAEKNETKDKESSLTVFSAKVKDSKIDKFFGNVDASGYKDVSLTVEYSGDVVYRYVLTYSVDDDLFTISTDFSYDK